MFFTIHLHIHGAIRDRKVDNLTIILSQLNRNTTLEAEGGEIFSKLAATDKSKGEQQPHKKFIYATQNIKELCNIYILVHVWTTVKEKRVL